MKFLTPLDTRAYKSGEFVLLADFLADFTWCGEPYRLAIPRGFITNFASVPKLIQALPGFDVNGDSRIAAVLHDYAYCCCGALSVRDLITGAITMLELTREECDDLLFAGLVANGYQSGVAAMFWCGVRIGGFLHWHKRAGLNTTDFVPDTYWGAS